MLKSSLGTSSQEYWDETMDLYEKWCAGDEAALIAYLNEEGDTSELTDEELAVRISEGLFVDEAKADGIFESDFKAEYIERAAYVCPFCGFSEFESHGNEFECKGCGKVITYGTDKVLSGVGFDFPFRFVNDWYEYQKDFVNKFDNILAIIKFLFV